MQFGSQMSRIQDQLVKWAVSEGLPTPVDGCHFYLDSSPSCPFNGSKAQEFCRRNFPCQLQPGHQVAVLVQLKATGATSRDDNGLLELRRGAGRTAEDAVAPIISYCWLCWPLVMGLVIQQPPLEVLAMSRLKEPRRLFFGRLPPSFANI